MLRYVGALGLSCLMLTGCVDPQKQKEIAEELERKKDLDVRIVADVATFDNTGPLRVQGVGLVTGLAGTGHSPAGLYRELMEQILLKSRGPRGGEMINERSGDNVRKILDNPDNCLVIVTGHIPAGARKGDRFDVDVTLPDGSKATSLEGGTLEITWLRVYEAEAAISKRHENSSRLLPGHIFAHAKGQLVVGFGNDTDPNELKRGKVWQGGVSRVHRPYALVMRNDEKSLRIANNIAQRVNFMYQDDPKAKKQHADFTNEESRLLNMGNVANELNQHHDPTGMGTSEMAKAASKDIINVRVPYMYRLDHDRFLHVASVTPLRGDDPKLVAYRERLKKMLLDPRETVLAARRLEALGRPSIPLLKDALENEHPMIRFAGAEALAYLGSPAGVDVLSQIAANHPILARNCTTALASLGEIVCREKLGNLLANEDRALRCSAFHALTSLDENDPRLGGAFLREVVWLYRVPNASNPMVFYSTSKRPQVVIFGRDITLAAGTSMIVGNFTVKHHAAEDVIYVKRISLRGEQKFEVKRRLDEVLSALVELGATYPDIVDFLRKANDYQVVSCPVTNWIVTDVPLSTIIESGREMKNGR